MSRRDDSVTLNDMHRHAHEAVELLGDAGSDELGQNRVMQLALTRLVEIIGEAANRVSPAMREANQQIPWAQIIGMRNRLIHGYDVIDFDLLWNTIKTDIPVLIVALEEALKKIED